MDLELLKKQAGEQAAHFIKDGMIVGIGTGSTVYYFINELTKLCKKGLKIQAVSSSDRSYEQAKAGGIPLIDINSIKSIDITVDGADEVDSEKRLIKGGGGALLREKILANSSKEMIVIVDESKVVEKLGTHPLPVEILPFAHVATINKINMLGFRGELRALEKDGLYVTDNGNYIYDIHFENTRDNPEEDHFRIIQIPGVIETGYFFNLAGQILIARSSGQIEHRK